MANYIRRILLSTITIVLIAASIAIAATPIEVGVPDIVTAQIVQFIGGAYINVTTRRSKMRTAPHIIALDKLHYIPHTSRRRGNATTTQVHFLLPEEKHDAESLLSDPATLPYIAELVANTLSEVLPTRRTYLQRRLGEFNSQLRSLLITGRKSLKGTKILCASKYLEPFMRAFGAEIRVVTPDEARAIAEATGAQPAGNDKWSIILDWKADARIRSALAGRAVVLEPDGGDLLRSIYIAILELRPKTMRN